MLKFAIPLSALAFAAAAGGASAMPVAPLGAATASNVEQVRVICDSRGRCFETRRRPRVVQRYYYSEPAYSYPSYSYAPAYGYYGPGYRSSYGYYGAPSVGFSFGFGGRHW